MFEIFNIPSLKREVLSDYLTWQSVIIWYDSKLMRVITSFLAMLSIKILSTIFFKMEVKWINDEKHKFQDLRLMILLNHTSLYEPIFLQGLPISMIAKLSKKMVAPGADKTLDRPIVGFFWKLISPGFISITRKRDKSWFEFLKVIKEKHIIMIAPEGRMKRASGLDAYGKPMSVRSGVAEIIQALNDGNIFIGYSGGLHHVQHPGEIMPRLFKTIKMNFEQISVADYKAQFSSEGIQLRRDIVADLESRIVKNTPA